jgi:beta-galactosidase
LRTVRLFNDGWLFRAADATPDQPDSDFERVTLPHTNIVLPHHNFDNLEYQFISTYRKRFRLPQPREGRRVYVDFDGAMIASTVAINGHVLGDYEGGFTPFSFDITDYLIENGENLLTVRLDSSERPDIPPYGNEVDYLTFGGIYRDVWLRYEEPCHVTRVFVRTWDITTAVPKFQADIYLKNTSSSEQKIKIFYRVSFPGEPGASDLEHGVVNVPSDSDMTIQTTEIHYATGVKTWSLENPNLYRFDVKIQYGDKSAPYGDYVSTHFGFREARFDKDGSFYLNGEKLKLRGLNRHQTFPYIGAAAPKRLQEKDADIVKYELGCNIVRTSHYPQSPHFLNRCDEIGLLVFEEIPGWQHIGDDDWQGISLRDVQAMIERDRNHPSIVLWGVRINESWDNTAFYTRTNELAHRLDPTRQTGGVRNFITSEFLEDVFTYNDFSNSVIDPIHTPHFVTEFNGHMFPTKTWDQEERMVEHAVRHARIQNKAAGMDKVVGAIGWCAFDYNTHREFGSGDRICYHGVMDMFRLPKFAAYFYESQISPSVRPVLRAATLWTRGDRSEGGVDPLIVFSNCDEIEVFTGEELVGRYTPDCETFPNLPYPPYQIHKLMPLWQPQRFSDLRLVGYVNGQPVAEQQIAADGLPRQLILETDHDELNADGMDMTRLVFKIVDKFGNRLPFTNQAVTFEIDGPADLIGENPFAIMGGQAALFVKARHEPGTVTITAKTMRLPNVTKSIIIK